MLRHIQLETVSDVRWAKRSKRIDMTIPEIRLVKRLVEIANELNAKELLDVTDWRAFGPVVMQRCEPKLHAGMGRHQIERCIGAAYTELNQ